ncbi:MAG TPA: response regulator transcription factor [Edaphocola sp.]|nr:response regulator transcription factor [Edaphocola sp.]
MIRIAIVDDNGLLIRVEKEKLSFYKDIEIEFSAFSGTEAIEKLKDHKHVELILMDIEMPDMNGIQTTTIVKKLYPHIKVLMLTVFDNDENIFKSIQAGADGYLLKDIGSDELYKSIVQTLEGGAAMTPSIALKTIKLLRNPNVDFSGVEEQEISLSKREIDVLEHLSKGLSYTSIANNLFISPNTVRKHIENIYQKLRVHSKLEAVQEAQRRRII